MSARGTRLVFVYGTLMRGEENHFAMAGQDFRGPARTLPGWSLWELEGYPGLGPAADDVEGVVGEVWAVSSEALAKLDAFEGVDEGLYARRAIALAPPWDAHPIDAYVYLRGFTLRPRIGPDWKAWRMRRT